MIYAEAINKIKSSLERNFFIYPDSFRQSKDLLFFIVKKGIEKYLGICGIEDNISTSGFNEYTGIKINLNIERLVVIFYRRNSWNLEILKRKFPTLLPSSLGMNSSFGFGDRLGIAGPAHIKAANKSNKILPVLAQQSIRELEKTNRSFTDVVEASIWSILQEGYTGSWGADADHIKDRGHFTEAADQGMTMFTLDTSEVLEDKVKALDTGSLKQRIDRNSNYFKKVKNRYIGKSHKIGDYTLKFDEEKLMRLVLTYEKALDFVEEIFHLLKNIRSDFDYEVSFDETNSITTPEAHYFISSEMISREIEFSSMALKFPGIFEKGIDYQGKISDFKDSVKIHGEIARVIGGYRLSLHSGSDKFSVYSLFYRYTKGFFHIKTSGTSWLEALRVIAICEPTFFREIFKIAVDKFNDNIKTYHVNLSYNDIPKSIDDIADNDLNKIINNIDLRRVLHIAYGSILDDRRSDLFNTLYANEKKYYQFLIDNIDKHFKALGI